MQKWLDELILEIKKALGLVDEMADDAAKKEDDLTLEKLNLAKKMWDEFDYKELLSTPAGASILLVSSTFGSILVNENH